MSFSDNEENGTSVKTEAMYSQIIESIFFRTWKKGMKEFEFGREEILETAKGLFADGLTKRERPKNEGDVIYTFRHRKDLPESIRKTEPADRSWIILGAGDAKYRFRLNKLTRITPSRGLLVRKIPDATPQIILRNSLSDEQALLAKMRYNRLIDIFLGITAYSLQNHLRTKIPNYGQIEIDELYVGVDKSGVQYVVPVQAKGAGKNDNLGAIQTIQDVVYCTTARKKNDFTHLKCRAVSAKLMRDGRDEIIAMSELDFDGDEVILQKEAHYRLVDASKIEAADLEAYASHPSE